MNINDLPPELLAMIFSKIDDFYQKIKLERVCKHWRQTIPLDWKATKTCPVPLNDMRTLGFILNRWKWLEELWLQNVQIGGYLDNQLARRMKCLKHLKLINCKLDDRAVNSLGNLFGQQLCSFILDETEYHPYMRKLTENNSSKLEHLNLGRNCSDERLPKKLPSNLKSFSLSKPDEFGNNSSNLLSILARDCKNLKVLHLEFQAITTSMILDIGKIKSLVYLHLTFMFVYEAAFKDVVCNDLPNLKALRIGGYCSEETVSTICQARSDLVYLNVCAGKDFQIPDSLNSLTLRNPIMTSRTMNVGQFLTDMLFDQQNKSIQNLDIRELILPSSSEFIKKLLGKFKDLKSIHIKRPITNADLPSLIEKHLGNGRKITIYFHFNSQNDAHYYKYILPDDLSRIKAGWRPKMNGKCENLVLKKLIKETIGGGNEQSFLDEYWME